MSGLSIAKSLELLLLSPTTTREDVQAGCELAREYHLAAVVAWPVHISLAHEVLAGSDTRTCAAIGFPYGQETTRSKLAAVEQAQVDGADELAVMIDHSALVSGELGEAIDELREVVAHSTRGSLVSTRGRAQLTLVAETTLYDSAALAPLWAQLHESPVGFLQTSAGHQSRAVTDDHVRLLRELLPSDVAVKAVGGVHDFDTAAGLLASGAVRVGTGSAIAIAEQERQRRQVRSSR